MMGTIGVTIKSPTNCAEEITVAKKQEEWQFTHWLQWKPQKCLEKEQGVM